MALDLNRMHDWIVEGLAGRRSVGDSMRRLINRCEAARPHPDWEQLRLLPYDDLSPLVVWIEHVFSGPPPVRPLRGLWSGLFNPVGEDDQAVADIYVCGS